MWTKITPRSETGCAKGLRSRRSTNNSVELEQVDVEDILAFAENAFFRGGVRARSTTSRTRSVTWYPPSAMMTLSIFAATTLGSASVSDMG
jgi:hypothetical protein